MKNIAIPTGSTVMEELGLHNAATLNDTESELGTEAIGHNALTYGYNNRNIPGYTGHMGIVSARCRDDILRVLEYNRERGIKVPFKSHILFIEHDDDMTLTQGAAQDYKKSEVVRERINACDRIIPFIDSPAHQEMLEAMGRPQNMDQLYASELWNNKGNFIQWMNQNELIDTPEGRWTKMTSFLPDICEEMLEKHDEILLKPTRGVAGIGMARIKDVSELDDVLDCHPEIRRCLRPYPPYYQHQGPGVRIEKWHKEVIASPSAVMWIGNAKDQDRMLQISEQINDKGVSHAGNIWPIEGEWIDRFEEYLSKTFDSVANRAREDGVRGYLGLDFIVTGDEILAVEANCRYTGALPGKFVAMNNGWDDKHIYTGNISLPEGMDPQGFEDRLSSAVLEYFPTTEEWCTPINYIKNEDGSHKAQVLIASKSRKALHDLMRELGLK
jgi:hypothetical protein